MKILIAEEGLGSAIYGGALASGFERLGHDVRHFCWSSLRAKRNGAIPSFADIKERLENRLLFGPLIKEINNNLINRVKDFNPHFVFLYRGVQILPETIRYLTQALGVFVFGYNNDDPFSDGYKRYYWRHFLNAAPLYSHVFSYRIKNVHDYKRLGVNSTLLRSYFRLDKNFPVSKDSSKFLTDVIFVGHFENDGRDESLLKLLRLGVDIKIYGPEWRRSKNYYEITKALGYEIVPLNASDYNLALNSAKIALVFLSKLNNDTYTRRCFEIPATKTLMLAEYTEDLASMFEEDAEAIFFRTTRELVLKVERLLQNEALINQVASRGYLRLLNDGHEVVDRCEQILSVFKQLNDGLTKTVTGQYI